MNTTKCWSSLLVALCAAVLSSAASAELIFDSTISENGTGFGTQANILTLHDSGGAGSATDIENGTVAWNGSAETCTGDDVVCDPDGKTSLYTFGQLDYDNANDIMLIWNPDEVGSSVETQVDELTLTIYNQNGSVFFSAGLASPIFFPTIDQGAGSSGFGFRLDDTESAQLNLLLAPLTPSAVDNLIIGLHSSVSFVDNGPDTWTIRNICESGEPDCGPPPSPDPNVPEPHSILLIALALLAAGGVRTVRSRRFS